MPFRALSMSLMVDVGKFAASDTTGAVGEEVDGWGEEPVDC